MHEASRLLHSQPSALLLCTFCLLFLVPLVPSAHAQTLPCNLPDLSYNSPLSEVHGLNVAMSAYLPLGFSSLNTVRTLALSGVPQVSCSFLFPRVSSLGPTATLVHSSTSFLSPSPLGRHVYSLPKIFQGLPSVHSLFLTRQPFVDLAGRSSLGSLLFHSSVQRSSVNSSPPLQSVCTLSFGQRILHTDLFISFGCNLLFGLLIWSLLFMS
mmetsp:Transcript_8334/g.13578  ORF Transcript_8334/g.13578 Transcript_8334/m.13578 type:complete len:211 (-) Transcript_8334:3-635(-)